MRTKPALFLAGLFSLLATVVSTQADDAPLLRYRLAGTQTNVFRVQVDVTGEFGTDILQGNLFVITSPVTSNVFRVACRGTLNPKREPRSSMNYYPGQYPRWPMPLTFGESSELQIDEHGQTLRSAADAPLAIPLGSVLQNLVEQFSDEPLQQWTAKDTVVVMDDPLALGPALSFTGPQPYPSFNFMPGRPGPAYLPAKRELKCEIKQAGGGTATIHKSLRLQTVLKTGNQPRIIAEGDGEATVDRETGLLRESEIQCTSTITTENATRRNTLAWKCKQLQGDELKQALNPPPPPPAAAPTKLTDRDVDEILADLRSSDMAKRQSAANRLRNAEPEHVTAEFRNAMATLASDPDSYIQQAAAGMLAKVATKEQIPVLVKLMKNFDYGIRQSAITALGRFHDKRAIDALVEFVASGDSDTSSAVTALTNIGPDAEDAVLRLLNEKNVQTRRQACSILKSIGTRKSLAPLKELAVHPDRMLSEAAADAVRTITMRQ